jgi:nucleotide-binding universal stress UspA family protein
MNNTERQVSISRILVCLDTSRDSLAALDMAADLASRLRAALLGLFVEDINLLRVAELPFAKEVSFFSPSFRHLELQQLEQQLRAQANQVRRALVRAAERAQVPWEFRTTRGVVAAELLATSGEADLIVVGRLGRSLTRHLGSTVRTLVLQGRGMTMIVERGHTLITPPVVIYHDSALARKALDTAAHLVPAGGSHLSVIIVADDKDSARRLRADALMQLQEHGLGADFWVLINPSLSTVAQLVRMQGNSPLVLALGQGPLDTDGLCVLISEAPNPVLLVR